MIFNCKNCEYIANNHWNLKMHNLSSHTTKEERSKQKYYCDTHQPSWGNTHRVPPIILTMIMGVTTISVLE